MKKEQSDDKAPFPEHQRKLIVLSVLAGILILLFWIWTLPLNFHEQEGENAGSTLFSRITTTIKQAKERGQ